MSRKIPGHTHWRRLVSEQPAKRVFWRFVTAQFLLIVLLVFLTHDVTLPAGLIAGCILASLWWLLPIRLLRPAHSERNFPWLSYTILVLVPACYLVLAVVPGRELDEFNRQTITSGFSAWIAASSFVLFVYRGLWEPFSIRKFGDRPTLLRVFEHTLFVGVALWAGLAIHPLIESALQGPLEELSPDRVLIAERYLATANRLINAIPINAATLVIALATLALGSRFLFVLLKGTKRVAESIALLSIFLFALTSFTYVTVTSGADMLESALREARLKPAEFQATRDEIYADYAIVTYIKSNDRAVAEIADVLDIGLTACRKYNNDHRREDSVPDDVYRYYGDVVNPERAYFNIGSETLNCNHQQFITEYYRAMQGLVRVGRLADAAYVSNREPGVIDSNIRRLSTLGDELSVGNSSGLSEAVTVASDIDFQLRVANSLLDERFSALAAEIVDDGAVRLFAPVLREFLGSLMSESTKSYLASRVRSLEDAADLATAAAGQDAGSGLEKVPGLERFSAESAVQTIADDNLQMARSARSRIATLIIEEGGLRASPMTTPMETRIFRFICVIRPTSCRHVF